MKLGDKMTFEKDDLEELKQKIVEARKKLYELQELYREQTGRWYNG